MHKRIAVITADTELAEFYKLEFLYRGFDVDVFSKSRHAEGEYLISLVDTDTVGAYLKNEYGITVEISSVGKSNLEYPVPTLTWPTPIEDIDKLCDLVLFGEEYARTQSDDTGDDWIIADIQTRTVTVGGRTVKLTQSELDVLLELCGAAGEIVSRERIMEILGATQGNISDVYVHRLRKKIESFGNKRFIFSERGIGYRTVLKFKV